MVHVATTNSSMLRALIPLLKSINFHSQYGWHQWRNKQPVDISTSIFMFVVAVEPDPFAFFSSRWHCALRCGGFDSCDSKQCVIHFEWTLSWNVRAGEVSITRSCFSMCWTFSVSALSSRELFGDNRIDRGERDCIVRCFNERIKKNIRSVPSGNKCSIVFTSSWHIIPPQSFSLYTNNNNNKIIIVWTGHCLNVVLCNDKEDSFIRTD